MPRNSKDTAPRYDASAIEVLEGLEAVRRHPGMYIGGTDAQALHHLVAEIVDNSMDEAVAGHADRIDIHLGADGRVRIADNGRGIPVDPHPKLKKPALEVILTTLHSGGKFSNKAYATSGGLHGVGLSVVNALSEKLSVTVGRNGKLYGQDYAQGRPLAELKRLRESDEQLADRGVWVGFQGTVIEFLPDPAIFGSVARLRPDRLYRMARSKAYLYRGVRIGWSCDPALLDGDEAAEQSGLAARPDLATRPDLAARAEFHFPGGLRDFLLSEIGDASAACFEAVAEFPAAEDTRPHGAPASNGRVEFAVTWPVLGTADGGRPESFSASYCNTVPTPQGGTHESGFFSGMMRALRAYAELRREKRGQQITSADVAAGACSVVSVFIRNPSFQGQTKEKLVTPEAAKLVEAAVRDRMEQWLAQDPRLGDALLEAVIANAEERLRKRDQRETGRKTPTSRLRLPGKLADCARRNARDTEIFLVEGDSAGGSAKSARNRETQAILPLRGKILNVANASIEKLRANREVQDIVQALGAGSRKSFDIDQLRYERVIIMTDADVDGAHIASLLMTFFLQEMPGLIDAGRLFLAQPPLYRIQAGGKSAYARDDAHRDRLLATEFKGRKVEIGRFKGLGEMAPAQLKETTMNPATRSLLRVDWTAGAPQALGAGQEAGEEQYASSRGAARQVAGEHEALERPGALDRELAERLMGKRPELRLAFIQENAAGFGAIDV